MDWQNVELIQDVENDENTPSEPIIAGLDASPESLHGDFLSGLPHLAETMEGHHSILSVASQSPESHYSMLMSMQTADQAIAELGGHREGDSLILPLSGAIQDRVQLEMSRNSDGVALRINAENEDGDHLIRAFRLPPGCELAQAGWRGRNLVLSLNKE